MTAAAPKRAGTLKRMARPLDSQMRSVLGRVQLDSDGSAAPAPTDVRTLHEVFAAYRNPVYKTCRRLTGNDAAADDLTQQVLMTAWDKLPNYRAEAKFSTWLYGIVLNVWRNKQRKRRELLYTDGVFEVGDPAVGVMSQLQRQEREQVFRDVCEESLEADEQQIVYLRYARSMPRGEIESLLKLEKGRVRVVLQRATRKLERALRAKLMDLGHGTSFVRSSM